MTNGRGLLFSVGLMGVLASGCGPETYNPGDAHLQALDTRGFRLSSELAGERAGCSGPAASLYILPNSVADRSERTWLCSNFRFEIEGLPTSRIGTFDGMVAMAHPSIIEVGDLKLTISMADYAPWVEWAKSWFFDRRDADADEKPATLTLLGPDLQEELVKVRFSHVGVLALTRAAVDAVSLEDVAQLPPSPPQSQEHFTVELYAEELDIDWLD